MRRWPRRYASAAAGPTVTILPARSPSAGSIGDATDRRLTATRCGSEPPGRNTPACLSAVIAGARGSASVQAEQPFELGAGDGATEVSDLTTRRSSFSPPALP